MSGARISYGKLEVPVQCVGVAPLRGLPEIPESPVRALDTGLLACEVSMEVLGQGFLAAYTEGDNRDVVATDTMKNVILRHALEHDGAVPEGFLDALGRRFLGTYPEMEGLRLTRARAAVRAGARRRRGGAQRPAVRARRRRPRRRRAGAGARARTARSRSSRSAAGTSACGCSRRRARRSRASPATTRRRCPSAPTGRCSSTSTCTGATPTRPTRWPATRPATSRPPRCATSCRRSSTTFVSESIQHLVHEMGQRLLERFPGLAEVSFGGREPHVRSRAGLRRRRRPQGLHRGVPRLGPDHPDPRAMTRCAP